MCRILQIAFQSPYNFLDSLATFQYLKVHVMLVTDGMVALDLDGMIALECVCVCMYVYVGR